jgi:T-complex protein 11
MVKEMMHKAFWDVLKEELNQNPPEYSRALVLLEEIKDVNNISHILALLYQIIINNFSSLLSGYYHSYCLIRPKHKQK